MSKILQFVFLLALAISPDANAVLRAVAGGGGGGSGGGTGANCTNTGGVVYNNANLLTCNISFTTNGAGAVSASASVTAPAFVGGTVNVTGAITSGSTITATGVISSAASVSAPTVTITGSGGKLNMQGTGSAVGTNASPAILLANTNNGIYSSNGSNVIIANGGGATANFTSAIGFPAILPAAGSAGGADLGGAGFGWRKVYVDYTNTGTVGAVTINKAAGRVNIAGAGTSVVVTNSVATAAAHIFCNVANVDTTAKNCQVTPGPGTMTITLNAAATAQVAIDFFIVNAD